MKKINNGELNINDIDKEVTLYGFVENKRKMGELIFVDLRDRWGKTQIVIKGIDKHFTKESVLKIKGKVVERKEKNPKLATGEIEIIVSYIEVLSLAEQLPFIVHDELEAKEETRIQHRFLDLRRPIMSNKIILRHKFNKAIRDFLDSKDFLEIETPILSKSTPEGARDFLVSTRKKGHFFALPQSPQIYKQLLMASGFEKYFQITKTFRDEDSRKDRQPEFTQLDIEMSYAKEEDVQNLVEKMLYFVFKKINREIKIPFNKMDYKESIERFGNDKPDIRFENELNEATSFFKETNFNAFKMAKNIKFIHLKEELTKKEIKQVEEVAKKNYAKGVAWVIDGKEKQGLGFKFFPNELKEISKKFNLKGGTFLFVADEYSITTKVLGAIRVFLSEKFNWTKNKKDEIIWIINWPLFEKDEKTKKYNASHHPFTSPAKDSINDFDTNKEEAKARSYDLVFNGFEIGGGSVRISDKEIQNRMFKAVGLSEEEYTEKFNYFLEIFKYGLPPHAGIAFGIDRILMIITNSNSIREVIPFPKNQSGIAIMEKAPSQISEKQLEEYFIKIK